MTGPPPTHQTGTSLPRLRIEGGCGIVELATMPDGAAPWAVTALADWAPGPALTARIVPDPARALAAVSGLWRAAALTLVNVEGAVAEGLRAIDKDGPHLAIPAPALAMLTAMPHPVACLANNHIGDFGAEGVAATLAALGRAGIGAVGAGRDVVEATMPSVTEVVPGVRVAVVNIAEGEESRADGGAGAAPLALHATCERIGRLRQQGLIVVAVVHAGVELLTIPPPHIRSAYRLLAGSGAAAVIGHHPHVAQGFEIHGGVPIFYSLGNFLCSYEGMTDPELTGYGVRLEFSGERLHRCEVWPYRMGADGLGALPDSHEFWSSFADSSAAIADDRRMQIAWARSAREWVLANAVPDLLQAASSLTPPRARLSMCLTSLVESVPRTTIRGRLIRRGLQLLARTVARSGVTLEIAPRAAERHAAARLANRFDSWSHQQLHADGFAALLADLGRRADAADEPH